MAAWIFWACVFFIGYTYLFYPLLIATIAWCRPRPVQCQGDTKPTISVILAACNEQERVETRIQNLLAQDYPPERVEIIAVADGSTDETAHILTRLAQTHPQVRAICLERNQGKAAAVNAGVAAAQGEVLLFADARQTFAPDVFTHLAGNFADPEIGSVSGELMLNEGDSGVAAQVGLYWRYEKWIRRSESACGSMLGATGAIYAIRRSLWRPLPEGTILDDFLTPMRIVLRGKRAIFEDRAVAYDRASTHARQEFKRKVRTLAGNFQAFALEPALLTPWGNPATWFQVWSHKVFRVLAPYALVLLLLSSLLAPGSIYSIAAVLQTGFYGMAALGWYGERLGRPMRWRLVNLAYTFVTLNAAAAGGMWLWLQGCDTRQIWHK